MFKLIHKFLHLIGQCNHDYEIYTFEDASYKQKVYRKITYKCTKCDYSMYEIHLNGVKIK